MEILSEQQSEIIEVYIATFNRAPDAAGLAYWVTNMDQNGWTIDQIAQSFFDSDEVSVSYPDTLSNGDFIDKVYNNVLNRDSDTAGKAYWVEQMDNGISKNDMIITILNGAKADTGYIVDKQILENKKEVGKNFAITLELDDIDLASTSMSLVTADSSSVQKAKDKQELYKQESTTPNSTVEGTENNDIIEGTEIGNYIYGWDGDDTIITGKGDSTVKAGLGIDSIYGNEGIDTIYGQDGNDTVYAKAGDDMIYGENGNDSLHGEDGNDTISGGDGDDYIYGEEGDNILLGNDGNDYIYGGVGVDIIYGNNGDDNIYANDGANQIDGGEGDDTIFGGIDIDTIYGGAANDTIYGNAGNDILDGLTGDDAIYAGSGDDTINGNDGTDILHGGDGNDTIDGEKENDTITGGIGADILTGGEGIDNFIISMLDSTLDSMDYITDFEANIDKFLLVDQGTEIISATSTDVSAATSLQTAADIAAADNGSINALVNWFTYDDNTYVVQDLNEAVTFDNTTDVIIELQGIINLLGLSTSSVSFA
ncbi:MAG: DUF4214 domain-containing protein [Campylobacterota bacterium]|nr:DUF4214 domain-containing protein [Campylobacterota bacterium]